MRSTSNQWCVWFVFVKAVATQRPPNGSIWDGESPRNRAIQGAHRPLFVRRLVAMTRSREPSLFRSTQLTMAPKDFFKV